MVGGRCSDEEAGDPVSEKESLEGVEGDLGIGVARCRGAEGVGVSLEKDKGVSTKGLEVLEFRLKVSTSVRVKAVRGDFVEGPFAFDEGGCLLAFEAVVGVGESDLAGVEEDDVSSWVGEDDGVREEERSLLPVVDEDRLKGCCHEG